MFVQVIKGRTNDADGFRGSFERWRTELKPGATGFLGGTAGVADDGTFIMVARFEDEAAAKANSERPEQSAFFEESKQYFDGEPTFRESSDTSTLFDGGSNDAGFVQVMEGKVADRAKAEAMQTPEMLEQIRKARPDLLGGLRVWLPDGEYVEVAYFTGEADARKGESSAEFEAPRGDFEAVFGQPTYTDLKDPILV
jgi:hypothetical protein